jgi:hypothetical protein
MTTSYLTPEEVALLQSSGLKREAPFLITNVSNTQFSVARHYGGCMAYGQKYTYNPLTDELIRDDVLKWIGRERKKIKKEKTKKSGAKQKSLF